MTKTVKDTISKQKKPVISVKKTTVDPKVIKHGTVDASKEKKNKEFVPDVDEDETPDANMKNSNTEFVPDVDEDGNTGDKETSNEKNDQCSADEDSDATTDANMNTEFVPDVDEDNQMEDKKISSSKPSGKKKKEKTKREKKPKPRKGYKKRTKKNKEDEDTKWQEPENQITFDDDAYLPPPITTDVDTLFKFDKEYANSNYVNNNPSRNVSYSLKECLERCLPTVVTTIIKNNPLVTKQKTTNVKIQDFKKDIAVHGVEYENRLLVQGGKRISPTLKGFVINSPFCINDTQCVGMTSMIRGFNQAHKPGMILMSMMSLHDLDLHEKTGFQPKPMMCLLCARYFLELCSITISSDNAFASDDPRVASYIKNERMAFEESFTFQWFSNKVGCVDGYKSNACMFPSTPYNGICEPVVQLHSSRLIAYEDKEHKTWRISQEDLVFH
jgi:hypothetical protein